MSFFSSFAEKLGLGKKPDAQAPVAPVNIEEKKQDLANLEAMRQHDDFNSPATRALDDKRMEELRSQIASAQAPGQTQATVTQFPTPTVEAQPMQPIVTPEAPVTQIPQVKVDIQPTAAPEAPQELPVEQPKAA